MGAQADARRKLGFIVASVVSVLVLALWISRLGDGDTPFWAALIIALGVAWLVLLLVVKVLVSAFEMLPELAKFLKFLRDLSGKNG